MSSDRNLHSHPSEWVNKKKEAAKSKNMCWEEKSTGTWDECIKSIRHVKKVVNRRKTNIPLIKIKNGCNTIENYSLRTDGNSL